ncbi:MAG TPA: thermonuclease family protein [Pirellulales bacterium]|nr:thermonuclease family protein [Pirellulales bacterium]
MSRRFQPPRRAGYAWLIVVIVVGLLRYWGDPHIPDPHAPGPQPPGHATVPAGEHHVVRTVDGDTLLVDRHTRLRLIGVNAPETVKPDWPVEPWGPEASAFTKQFVSGGSVRLEFDDERIDEYGRELAYVYVGDRMLNEELLLRGLARWEKNYHYSPAMKRRFQAAQDEARRKHVGIWSGKRGPLDAPAPDREPAVQSGSER